MDCNTIPELNAEAWGDALLAPLSQGRYPISGSLELTERCNFNCVHCYINQPSSSQSARAREMSTAQVKHILDTLAQNGCLFLTLTGGEPLLRTDFAEIYMHARKLGIIITLFTNATLLTPRIADLLAASRPHVVEITMYGATPETYEAVTRTPGSYERFVRGLELLLERNIRVALKSMILTLNKDELPAMEAFVERYGLDFRYDGTIWPRVDGDMQPLKYAISMDEMIQIDLDYPDRSEQWEKRSLEFQGIAVRNEYVYSCGAGLRTFHIDSTGRMSACMMARKPAFDLFSMNFMDAWQQIGELRNMKRQRHTECETCLVGALCLQCPGWSQAFYGDDESTVDIVCEIAKKRYTIFNTAEVQ